MDVQLAAQPRRVSRDELYALVWKAPISRLAAEFGITGNGLAKICDRLNVPYPPRGYWAKKEAGKPVVTFRLPSRPDGIPGSADISPTPLKSAPPPEVRAVHKREQKEREQENRRRARESWGWTKPLLEDLTVRDLYRFRITSAIFKAVETAGGRIEDAPINGKVSFFVSGHKVECSIVEKMVKPLKQPGEYAKKWTAYPEFHQSRLQSSGFLRISITTYLMGKQPQWIETQQHKSADSLPEIVGTIIGAGPILVEQDRQQNEAARRYQEEQARRYELQRLKEIDERQWARFQERAADWELRARLTAFMAEIQGRLQVEGDTKVGERQLSEWLAWACEKIEALDPLRKGVTGLFESIVR